MDSTIVAALGGISGDGWLAVHGDCVSVLSQWPDHSIDHAIYSPPFSDLFVYSDSACDMGNSATDDEFFDHYRFLVTQLVRIVKPGRVVAVHCSDLQTRKWKDGYVGLRPFSDRLRECHEAAGFIFYRRVTVWKDPVVEQARTHARNLGYSLLLSDSAMSAPGLPDYLMVFRTPGENETPITHKREDFSLDQWREWASPVWMTIDQGNVIAGVAARRCAAVAADERHVCPLQVDLIRRSVILWSNPGEVILSPFMGIGSEGFVALQEGRRFVGVELKESYWRQAADVLSGVEAQGRIF